MAASARRAPDRHRDGVPDILVAIATSRIRPGAHRKSVYRLWRDLGYAVGALLAGLVADALGIASAVWCVAAITFAAGVVVLVRMRERSR